MSGARRGRGRRVLPGSLPLELPQWADTGEPGFGRRVPWLGLALLVHLAAFAAWLTFWNREPDSVGASEPIPVTLLEPEPVAEAEERLAALDFRRRAPPRARDRTTLAPLRALAPPPVDALLSERGAAGGYSLEPGHGRLQGLAGIGSGGGRGDLIGSGNARAPVGSFEAYVGGMRQVGLDVVFVIDATGSMGWLIADVKGRVLELAAWMRELVPVTRLGVVAYRDGDDPEFLTRVQPLTLDARKVAAFLSRLEARGGGDSPEDLHAGLAAAIGEAGFQADAHRVILVLGDAPPHAEGMGETLTLVRDFHATGGTVTLVDTSFDANPTIAARRLHKRVEELQTLDPRGAMPEFQRLAEAGGGDAATLEGEADVARQLAVLVFGERWAEAVRPLLGEL